MEYREFLNQWKDNSLNVLCHTSGSTGMPKKIRLSKEIMRLSALRTASFFGLDMSSNLHSCISPDFIGGKMMAVRAEVLGCDFSFEKPSNTPLRDYNGREIDLLAVVPSQMTYLLDNPRLSSKVKTFLIGGASVPSVIRERIANQGLEAWETYGMTETASHIALRKIDKIESPFEVLPGILVDTDAERRLNIKIPINVSGGLENIKTNDIAEMIDNEHFFIKGRYDNIINSGGMKIIPEELEVIIEKELGQQVLITSAPDDKWSERIILVIDSPQNEIKDEDIMKVCRNNLQPHCVPKSILRARIELTSNGKKRRDKNYS